MQLFLKQSHIHKSIREQIVLVIILLWSLMCVTLAQKDCVDVAPDDQYTCGEQASFGKCEQDWMIEGNFCAAACGRCVSVDEEQQESESWRLIPLRPIEVNSTTQSTGGQTTSATSQCSDIQPGESLNCQQVVKLGRCLNAYIYENGYCQLSCNACQKETKVTADDQGRAEKVSLVRERTDSDTFTEQEIDENESEPKVSDAESVDSGRSVQVDVTYIANDVASQAYQASQENQSSIEQEGPMAADVILTNLLDKLNAVDEGELPTPQNSSYTNTSVGSVNTPYIDNNSNNNIDAYDVKNGSVALSQPTQTADAESEEDEVKAIRITQQSLLKPLRTKIPPPNFLIIMTDDQGYDDIGIHHKAGILKTPNMDRFANQSVEFSNFYTDSLCAPTRATQMTGRHHLKTGVWGVHGGMDYIDLDEELIGEPLLRAGYKTAHFGKWHSGSTTGYLPWNRGFEEAVNAHLYVYTNNVVMHNGVPEQTTGWVEDELANRIIDYLTQRAEDEEPFFINWAPMSIHHGRMTVQETEEYWVAPQKYMDMYTGKVQGDLVKVFASITYFDSVFGKVIDKLDELGLGDDTVVMFFGDNGPHLLNTDHHEPGPIRDIRVASGMYEEKGFIDENGVRNFFFARMPGTFPPGLVVDSNVYVADVFPTVMEFAKAEPAGDKPLDGVSFAPLLLGQKWKHEDRSIFYHEVLKNSLTENVLFWLNGERKTNKTQTLLNFRKGGSHGKGLLQSSAVRIGNFKYIKNNTYNIKAGDHVEHYAYRVQYNFPKKRSDSIYNTMYAAMDKWWKEILAEPASFQKPAYLIGYKGEQVSKVIPTGAHQASGGVKITTHHVSGFRKVGDYLSVKLIVKKAGTYQIKLNYGWNEYQGALMKAAIGTWAQISAGDAPYTFCKVESDRRCQMGNITLPKTTKEEEFIEMKLTLAGRSSDGDSAIFKWFNLIEFFMQ
eukprot:TRINITY_DN5117_c0_g3_i1.p1 TRINITY_DN5117_c0_g3~~TRINITY_DN5117_c0_g3_i1.p1  ORF type:complete len:1025 (-),score=120.72 TRINITY_DN5117_c0_g3_i1:2564-5407(-)